MKGPVLRKGRHWRPPSRLFIAAALFASCCSILFSAEKKVDGKPSPQCAQICVKRSCRLLGIPVEMSAIMEHMPPGDTGNSLAEMVETFQWIGLESEGRAAEYQELVEWSPPVIAHFKDHFVVVEEANPVQVRILDGYGRRKTLLTSEFRNRWDGKVLKIRRPEAGRLLPAFVGHVVHGAPRIRFKTLAMDAGEIENPDQAGTTDYRFELHNLGNAPLVIKRIRTDCKCAVSDKPAEPVGPGDSATITVKYSAGRGRGPFSHTAFVESNDPAFPVVALTIAGNTKQTLELMPPRIDFGRVAAGQAARARVFVRYMGDQPFQVVSTKASNPRVRVRSEVLSPEMAKASLPDVGKALTRPYDNAYTLRAEFDGEDLPIGKVKGVIDIVTSAKKFEKVPLPFEIEIVPEMRPVPGLVFLSFLRPDVQGQAIIKASLRNGKSFKLVSVRSEVVGLDCRYPEGLVPTAELRFSLTPDASLQPIDSSITVEYLEDGKDAPDTLSIPVYGYAPAKPDP